MHADDWIQIHLPNKNLHFTHLGPAPLFSSYCHKIRLFATLTFLILKRNTNICSNYNKMSFVKTKNHAKILKINIYIILLIFTMYLKMF